MELIIPDPNPYPQTEAERDNFLSTLRLELQPLSDEFTVDYTDIGRGAAWPAILVTVALLSSSVFFLGKRIEENLDAWISLGERFKAFIERATAKSHSPLIDQEGACLLALHEVVEKHPDSIRVLEYEHVLASWFDPRDPQIRSPDRLDHHPEALYVMAMRVNDGFLYVVGVKSSGFVEFVHRFSTHHMDFWLES